MTISHMRSFNWTKERSSKDKSWFTTAVLLLAVVLVFPTLTLADDFWSIQFESWQGWDNAGGRRYTTFGTGSDDFEGNLLYSDGNPIGGIAPYISSSVGTTNNNAGGDNPGPGWAYIPTRVDWQGDTTYTIDFIVLQREGQPADADVQYGLWAGLPSDDKGSGNYNNLFDAGEKPGKAATRPSLGTEGLIQVSSTVLDDGDGIFVSELDGTSSADVTFQFTTGSDVSGLDQMVLFLRTNTDRIHWDSISVSADYKLPATITKQPESQVLAFGDTAEFLVEVEADPGYSVSYQWYWSPDDAVAPESDEEIIGADSKSLVLENAGSSDGGYYYCKISYTDGLDSGKLYSSAALLDLEGDYAVIYPEIQGQLIDGWGFDIKWYAKALDITRRYARTLFVDDRMTTLRVAIQGEDNRPAHPEPGMVIESYYQDTLDAMTHARNARADVIFFAGKKLDGQESFPGWVKDENGIIPDQYAIMLADFLEFMEDKGFYIDVLGIDNEIEYNEGNITPARHKETIDELEALAVQRGFNVPLLIGPETFGPANGASWLNELFDNNWGDRLDIAGTHYYPRWRPLGSLQDFANAAGSLPKWHSEVHWTSAENLDVYTEIARAERCLAAVLDSFDEGFSQMVWWNYQRDELAGEIRQQMTKSTANSRPIEIVDHQGTEVIYETLTTRAFREENRIVVWVINNTPQTHSNYYFTLDSGTLSGSVDYTQWSESETTSAQATRAGDNGFVLTLPPETITAISLNYTTESLIAHYPLNGDSEDASGNQYDGQVFGEEIYTDGIIGTAMEFDANSYIKVPDYQGVTGGCSRTLSLWVRAEPDSSPRTIVRWGGTPALNRDWWVQLRPDGTIGVSTGGLTLDGCESVDDGTWRHITVVYNADKPLSDALRLYLDGHRNGTVSGSEHPETLPDGPLHIGINYNSLNEEFSFPFGGDMDDVRIYDYALDVYEIADLYFMGRPDGRICIPQDNYLLYDLTGDCTVDVEDLAIFVSDWLEPKTMIDFAQLAEEWLMDAALYGHH